MYKVINNQPAAIYLDTHCDKCRKEFEPNEDRYSSGTVICTFPEMIPFLCKECYEKQGDVMKAVDFKTIIFKQEPNIPEILEVINNQISNGFTFSGICPSSDNKNDILIFVKYE